ncbi:uncharacterized protein TRUGW13939_05736 [Talaromyces rugulosus]|uniref:Uncharacterized protein n=1 Tax=Talaromyces rugulosus TaxID=121627 RepID=A0A7H8QYW1_TALRU|nr:uncharacterized protein TRUGW13939_05736 [Talaromyces rugulosus]QKX58611.1 hypothetical protein TRUGW13939_05736 [Talaromyces rugulosus]
MPGLGEALAFLHELRQNLRDQRDQRKLERAMKIVRDAEERLQKKDTKPNGIIQQRKFLLGISGQHYAQYFLNFRKTRLSMYHTA